MPMVLWAFNAEHDYFTANLLVGTLVFFLGRNAEMKLLKNTRKEILFKYFLYYNSSKLKTDHHNDNNVNF